MYWTDIENNGSMIYYFIKYLNNHNLKSNKLKFDPYFFFFFFKKKIIITTIKIRIKTKTNIKV